MDPQPSPRLRAIAAYREAIRRAVEIAAERNDPHYVSRIKRRLARGDLFFLLVYVLGRKDVNHDWVFARCREVQLAPNGYLDLWSREHYKSTLITFGLTIQDILNNPEITVGIFSYSRPIAKAFLRQIKREFESNEILRGLFPDICWENPHRDAPKWSEDDGIIVRRKGNPKESTIEAWGLVDAQPTSKHFRLMVYDDVVTKDSVSNPEMISKVTEAWEASRNLTAEGGATRYEGTRWSHADTYRDILARGAAIERRHPATVDGTPDGEPVLFSRERLAEKRREMGPYMFAAQMLLDPTLERTQGFLDEWLQYYEPGGDYSRMNKYLLVDPANSKKKTSDYTAMAVIGLGDDENYYLLDAVRDRLSLTERGEKLFALHKKWRPTRVGYERYGVQADVEYFKERMREQNYRFEIVELGGQLAKNDRIRRMIPIFEAGRFYLPYVLNRINYEGERVDLAKAFVDEEYRAFPVAQHDDLFDVISRIADPEMQTTWPRSGRREPEHRYARRPARYREYSWMAY